MLSSSNNKLFPHAIRDIDQEAVNSQVGDFILSNDLYTDSKRFNLNRKKKLMFMSNPLVLEHSFTN